MTTETHRAIEAVWRIESAKVIASLTRLTGDVGLAEDLAQDALVAALEQWPESGVPNNPGAWLMAAAKRRGIDQLRRRTLLDRKHEQLGHELESQQEQAVTALDESLDDNVGDDLLRLVFMSCHPVLSTEAQTALTLRLLGGLTTEEIARAFLTSEPTIQQRIVRAKRALADAAVPFEVPRGTELTARLSSVLGVIYLIFNEGYAATAGDDWVRPALCEEALRLGRILAELMPNEAEVHGLVALMEVQASRLRARVGPSGEPVLLLDQDRGRWDRLLIGRGLAALDRAESIGETRGPYTIQAAIAACHARARTADATDWPRIAALYEELARLTPSPIVELNRAVAVSMAAGPAAALAIVDRLTTDPLDKGTWQTSFADLLATPLMTDLGYMDASDGHRYFTLGDIKRKETRFNDLPTVSFEALDVKDLTKRLTVRIEPPTTVSREPIPMPHTKAVQEISDSLKLINDRNWDSYGIDLTDRLVRNERMDLVVKAMLIQQALKTEVAVAGWALGDLYEQALIELGRQNPQQLPWLEPARISEGTRQALKHTIDTLPPAAQAKQKLAGAREALFRSLRADALGTGVLLKDDVGEWAVYSNVPAAVGGKVWMIAPAGAESVAPATMAAATQAAASKSAAAGTQPLAGAGAMPMKMILIGEGIGGKYRLDENAMRGAPQGSLVFITRP